MTITINSQIRGGKNNMIVTRTGHRFPKKEWAQWRDATVAEIRSQIPRGWKPIDHPVNITIDYRASDNRRRDMPAILDSIFHCLEKAGFCADDTHLWVAHSSRTVNKYSAGATIELLTEPDHVRFT